MDYDVIIVGARVAGAATGLLLARRGVRVLVVDRVSFPSDTISSHQLQVPGVARLRRWGLLDRLTDAGTPPTRRVRFDAGHVVLSGEFPAYEGVDTLYSPRRTVLDTILVEAAAAAGAEVRQNVRVEELIWTDERVSGIRGSTRHGDRVSVTARLVVGADGKRSTVAQAVAAAAYRTRPVLCFASYGYFAGVSMRGGELYQRPNRMVAAFPTNDDLTMVYVAGPLTEFDVFRADVENNHLKTLDGCGDLGDRVRAGVRAERLRTTPDQPNTFRSSHGPGWALVGDAGVVMDSISAQGITNALRDAELLADAIVLGLGGDRPMAVALADHQRQRDSAISAMYDFTTGLASFRPPGAGERQLLRSLQRRPAQITRFLGAFAGIEPPDHYFATANALRVLGPRGLARLGAGTVRDAFRGRRHPS